MLRRRFQDFRHGSKKAVAVPKVEAEAVAGIRYTYANYKHVFTQGILYIYTHICIHINVFHMYTQYAVVNLDDCRLSTSPGRS